MNSSKLKEFRKSLGLSQAVMADMMGYTTRHYQSLESVLNEMPLTKGQVNSVNWIRHCMESGHHL